MGVVYFGIDKANPRESVRWVSNEVVNGHWIIVGGSGAGKTHQIRNICDQLKASGMRRIYIFDPHGDIETDPQYTSVVEFSETSPYGINPLIVNPSPVYGGVRKRINNFVKMIQRYSSHLDDSSSFALRAVLKELYAQWGFDYRDPATWADRQPPTLDDLSKFLYSKLYEFNFGGIRQGLDRLQRAEDRDVERSYKDSGSVVHQRILYGSGDVLKSLYDRIENIKDLGVFKSLEPPFDPGKPIWRYDMSRLLAEEQGYLVELTLEEIFRETVARGFKQNEVDTLIFIDEAQRFISQDDQDHIVSVIFREIRKFGGGLALATQNCSVFPTDIVINSGTKIILGVDESYQDLLARTLGVERIRFIQPRKNALIQIKKNTDTMVGGRYIDTLLGRTVEGN